MADIKKRHKDNIDGKLFVDTTCIDCDTCRWMSPEIFHDIGDQSVVYHQPQTKEQEIKAIEALVSCPTASIGFTEKSDLMKEVIDSFPLLVDENVYHCGYHSEKSFGAASYFIQREEGNILIDSPRFASPLVKKLEKMGGIKYLFLTHRDDVADHEKFHEYFKCERIIHKDEISSSTRNVEIKVSENNDFELDKDLKIIVVPGHTKGHMVLLYKDKFLFTGDHLAWSRRYNHLVGFRGACWYSWDELKISMRKLLNYSFEWVLPGHGRRYYTDKDSMRNELKKCINWM